MKPFNRSITTRITRGALSLTLVFLLIEFFDELHYGLQTAVLPSLRLDLALSYAQIGLLLGLPKIIGTLVEPLLMLLGDTGLRKRLVVGGGLAIVLSLVLVASAASFPAVLFAFVLSFPASGAFVSLSQATLMDLSPGRQSQGMARWTVAGSLGNLLGPLLLAGGFALGLGWRWSYLALALFGFLLVLILLPRRFPAHPAAQSEPGDSLSGMFKDILGNLWSALRDRKLLRWLALLEMSDLLLDVFTGYAALYLADVAGFSQAQTSLAIGALMLASLVADLALIPLLERLPGRTVVRASATVSIFVYTAWMLVPWPLAKLGLLVMVRFSTIGWYPVLQGEAYAAAPGRSGTVMALTSAAGLLGGGLVWLVGWTAGQAGLPAAMGLLLLGPLSLALFVPKATE
jgi:FSR family fosmidomycin resistance protein-like MFS transporter